MSNMLKYSCPYCGKLLREEIVDLPFEWMCYHCGKLYSIQVLTDEEADEAIVYG